MEANSGDVTIRFYVRSPYFSNLFMTGDIDELGKGRLDRATKLTPATDGGYEGSLKLKMTKKSEMEIKYKYITHDYTGYIKEPEYRTLLILPGQKLIQIIDEYNGYHTGTSAASLILLEKLVGRSEEKKKQLGKPPKDAIPVQFVVRATLPHPTCRVVIFGNTNFLGNGDPLRGKTMQYTLLKWELDCFVAPNFFPIEYKYAIIDADNKIIHEDNQGPTRTIVLPDLTKEQKGINISLKINDVFRQEYHEGTSFAYDKYFYHRYSSGEAANARLNFRELLIFDSRTGKLVANDNFYGQLAMDCGKDCAFNFEVFITHDFTDSDLAHEQFCKSLLDPKSKVRKIILCSKYFANISPKRIAMMNHVLQTSTRVTELVLSFDTCCGEEKKNETSFVYEGLKNGNFKFITSVAFGECDLIDLLPIMEILKNNKTLKEISFYRCTEEREGGLAEHVIDQLFMNETITSVNIHQTISKKAKESLQKLLATNQSLTELNIGRIFSELKPFSESLKFNSTLQRLSVVGSGFAKEEVTCLFKTLASNEALQQFSLNIMSGQLKFSEDDIHGLFAANKTLTNMEIKVSDFIVHEQTIHEYTSRNKSIQRVLHNDLIVVLFNIARHHALQSLQIFPHDVWLHIVKYIPGRQYHKILNALFNDWSIRKVI